MDTILVEKCIDCGSPFEKMDEVAQEDRCPGCQANFRIASAAKALVDPVFAWHYHNDRGAKVQYPYLGDEQTGE